MVDGGVSPAHALAAADNAAGVLTVKVLRATTGGDDVGTVRALDLKGLPLGEARLRFKSSDREAEAQFDLPVEIRNDIARIEIDGEHSAGAVQLLDKRWRRRTVGVDHRLDRRHRAAAARLDLLSVARARRRSPTSGSPIAARPPRR